MDVLSSQRVDNPQLFALAVMAGGKRGEVKQEDEATQSNTYLKPQPVHGTARSVVVG